MERTAPEETAEPEPIEAEAPEEKSVAQKPNTSNNGDTGGVTTSQGSSTTPSDTSGSSDDWRQNMITDGPGYWDPTGGSYNDPDAQTGLIGGSSDTAPSASSDTSGAKPTPGSDGSVYADANGGHNGKTFNASDLYVDPADLEVDISGMIMG